MFNNRKKANEKTEYLAFSFVDNAILLTTKTINKNGFYEVWRQESNEHSIQILCFNPETKEFQAFDKFHHLLLPDVYDDDLWTPIQLHFTISWLKAHLVPSSI